MLISEFPRPDWRSETRVGPEKVARPSGLPSVSAGLQCVKSWRGGMEKSFRSQASVGNLLGAKQLAKHHSFRGERERDKRIITE